MKDFEKKYAPGKDEVFGMVHALLLRYADNKSEELVSFIKDMISDGTLSAAGISEEGIEYSNNPAWIYMMCANVCAYDYIGKDPDKERVRKVLEISPRYPEIREICKNIKNLNDGNDEAAFKKESLRAFYKCTRHGNSDANSCLYCLHMWLNDVHSPLTKVFFGPSEDSFERRVSHLYNLKTPLRENGEVKHLMSKLDKKLERLSGKSKEEIIREISGYYERETDINEIQLGDGDFFFEPCHSDMTYYEKVYEDTLYQYVLKAYLIHCRDNGDMFAPGLLKNRMKSAESMFNWEKPFDLETAASEISPGTVGDLIFNRETLSEREMTLQVQKVIMGVDYNTFLHNCVLRMTVNEIKKELARYRKDEFLRKVCKTGYISEAEYHETKKRLKQAEKQIDEQKTKLVQMEETVNRLSRNTENEKISQYRKMLNEAERNAAKREKETEKLKEEMEEKDIKIALLEAEIARLRRKEEHREVPKLDINGRYVFVCSNDGLCTKLKDWFPNSNIFRHSKGISIDGTDAVVIMTTDVLHHVYYDAKGFAVKYNIPVVHCPVKNFDGICSTIAEVLY